MICWLTGYAAIVALLIEKRRNQADLQAQLERQVDLQTFFDQATGMHPNSTLVTGVGSPACVAGKPACR